MQKQKISFDELTSAYTKSAFYSIFERFYLKKELQGILMIHIDNLKDINYQSSYEVGDKLICRIVRMVYDNLPNTSIVGRVNGEVFAVLLPNVLNKSHISEIAQNIVNEQRKPITIDDNTINTTLSIGVAVIEKDQYKDIKFEDAINRAKLAMDKAKTNGYNQICVFDERILEEIDREILIGNEIKNVVKNKDLSFKLLPIINLQTNKVDGFEIFARIIDNDGNSINAGEFIEIAKEKRMLDKIDKLVVHNACDAINKFEQCGFHDVFVSANISYEYFSKDSFYDEIMKIVRLSDIRPNLLYFELTEECLFKSYDRSKVIIDNFRKVGINFQLDDFGAGYSNFGKLQELGLPILKIDRSLIKQIDDGSEDTLADKSIEIAKLFNMCIIAEGVENEKQLEWIKSKGCDLGEGFYWGKPMTADEAIEFLRANS